MSRIELHCPSCGFDVPPTLMPPPKTFSCPQCLEEVPREKLTRLKVLHRNIAGAHVSGAEVSPFRVSLFGTWGFEDGAVGTATAPFNVPYTTGDLLVVCVAAEDNDTAPTGQLNGSDAMTTSTSIISAGWSSAILTFQGTPTVPGPQQVSVTFTGAKPLGIAVAMLSVAGCASSSPVDKVKSAAGQGTPNDFLFDSTATTALSGSRELAIGMLSSAYDGNSIPTFLNGFNKQQEFDQHGGVANTKVSQAIRQLNSAAAVRCNGTDPSGSGTTNACSLITIKPR